MNLDRIRLGEVIPDRRPLTISKDASAAEALEIMEEEGISHLVVIQDGRVVGVIAAWDLMEGFGSRRYERVLPKRIHVSALMSSPAITATPDTPLREAMSIMLRRDVSSLPVVSDGNLKAVVTETDLLKILANLLPEGREVRELVKDPYPATAPGERIVHARAKMLDTGARVLPVVEQARLVGLITDMVLARAFMELRETSDFRYVENAVRRVVVDDVMVEDPPRIGEGSGVGEAASAMVEAGLPALPVVRAGDDLVGVLLRKSLIRILSES